MKATYQKIKNNIEGKVIDWAYRKSAASFESLSGHFARLRGSTSATTYTTPIEYLKAYELATLLGTLCDIVASHLASFRWELQDLKGNVIEDKKFIDFMANPCNEMTAKELIEYATLHVILDGNIFWMLRQPTMLEVSRKDYKIMPLNPALVDVYTDHGLCVSAGLDINAACIGRYQVRIDTGSLMNVLPKDIIHVKSMAPHNILRGMGKVQQNTAVLDEDRMTSIFNRMFFSQGARVSLIVTPDKDLSPVTFGEYSKKMRDVYEGAENQGKIFISPFAGSVTPGNLSQNDMQYIEQKQFTVDRICEIIQVPSILLSGSRTSYDSSEGQLKSYYESTLPRYGGYVESALTKIACLLLQRGDVFFKLKYPQFYSKETAKDLFDRGVITGNEYRRIFGLVPDESDDRLNERFMTMQYVKMDYILDTGVTTEPATTPPTPDKPEKSIKKWSKPLQMSIHYRSKEVKSRIEKNMRRSVKSFYSGMEERVLQKFKNPSALSVKAKQEPFDIEDEIKRAKEAAKPMFTSALSISINEVNSIMGTDVSASTQSRAFNLVVEKLSIRYATETMNSRYDELRKLFDDFNSEGLPVSELAGELTDYFGELKGENAWKATRIARTESSHTWDQASVHAYKDIGVSVVDVIGCEDEEGDCNKQNVPISEADGLTFHPNHTGTITPSI
jgi:HK97 family phage portal protein